MARLFIQPPYQVLFPEEVASPFRLRRAESRIEPFDAQREALDVFSSPEQILDEGVAERSGYVNTFETGQLEIRVRK